MRIIKLNFDNGVSVIIPLDDIRLVEGGSSIEIYTPYRTSPYQFNIDVNDFVGLAYGDYSNEGDYNIIDINEVEPEKPAS